MADEELLDRLPDPWKTVLVQLLRQMEIHADRLSTVAAVHELESQFAGAELTDHATSVAWLTRTYEYAVEVAREYAEFASAAGAARDVVIEQDPARPRGEGEGQR